MAGDAPGTVHEDPASPGAAAASEPPAPARLALYRRYRPATFAEVKGQEHVTEPLRQALRNGRVNHAYLFSGPRGCGKTSSARILARSLNCAEGPTPDPCGTCESCLALAPAGAGSIDVIEIDAASHGGVDDARDLRERAFYAPVAGRFKVYIIDEAHMVTREGFNALLKLVEEPPPHLKFVFATTEPEKVIPTIRSRTHHYPFRLVPPAVLRELLEEILAAEEAAYQPSVIPLVVRAGAGSVRDSLSVLDQLLAGSGEEGLTYDRTVALLGYTDDSLLDEVVSAFAAGDGAAVFGAVDRVVQGGHDPRRFAADLLDRFRDLIILAAVPGAGQTGLLDAPADRLERMAGQAGSFGQAELARAAEILSGGLTQMRGTASPRLMLELMCAQVLLPGAGTGERALLARLERLERRLEGAAPAEGASVGPARDGAGPARDGAGPARDGAGPARDGPENKREPPDGRAPREEQARGQAPAPASGQPIPAAAASGPGARPPRTRAGAGHASADTFRQRWGDILEAVRQERKVAWILLRTASVASFDNGVLTISFPREGDAKGFAGSGCDQVLMDVLSRQLGLAVRVKAAVGTAPAAQVGASAPPPPPGPENAGHGTPTRTRSGATGQGGQDQDPPATPAPRSQRSGPARGRALAAPARTGEPAPPRSPGVASEEWPDDAAAAGDFAGAGGLTGMELIQRQLGGRVIEEIDEA